MQVKFNDNNTAYVTFYKWDYGQELTFDSVPENSEVHFPVKNSADAAVVKIVGNKCSIPDSALALDSSSFDAWLYIDNGTQGKTEKTIHFTLVQRSKPDEHIYSFEEDKVLDFTSKLDKFQGTENAGKTFVIDSKGVAKPGEMPLITVDSKLSETSSNPIANSAVAKVLIGGRLAAIETIYDYESLMDFSLKYFDMENEGLLIKDGEYVMVLALDDVYDENGEYGDRECLVKKAMYIYTSEDAFVIGDVSSNDFSDVAKKVNSHNTAIEKINTQIKNFVTQSALELLENVITLPDNHISSDTYTLRGAGIYIIDCETTEIVAGGAKRHLLTMSKGELFIVTEKTIDSKYVRSFTALTRQGIKHIPDVLAEDLDNCHYITKTETEKLLDSKGYQTEQDVQTAIDSSRKYHLIADETTTEDTTYVLVDRDADGNAFNLKRLRVIIDAAEAQTQTTAILCAADTYESSSGAVISSVNGGFFTSARISFYEIDAEEFGSLSHSSAKNSIYAVGTVATNVIYNANVKSIDKIMIRTDAVSKKIPAGTKIQIWGY